MRDARIRVEVFMVGQYNRLIMGAMETVMNRIPMEIMIELEGMSAHN